MLTKEEIEKWINTQSPEDGVVSNLARGWAMAGATWANEQNAAEIAELVEALVEAKSVIKAWHNMDDSIRNIPNEKDYLWAIYETQSPEMQHLNNLIKKYAPTI